VEASALNPSGVAGLHARSPLLRLQSDERLIVLVRRGNHGAFELLVARYQARLLAFCRHMLGSREDAEDVLQEVFAAAFNAILADDRPINVRPWLYRIARNRSLNHLRRIQPIGVDSMDVHLSEHGITTADKFDRREALRELVADVQQLPETQRTALLLREIDALSYEQIAEAMETTIPSVKSLLVRARVSLAEAAEARHLSCDDVRLELGEIAEGLRRRTTPPVRRHLRACDRCAAFRTQLRTTNKGLALLLPVGPLVLFKKLLLAHLGLSAGGGAGGTATGTAAVGAAVVPAAGSAGGSLISVGIGAVATKAAAGLAAAALVTASAVEIEHTTPHRAQPHTAVVLRAPMQPARALGLRPAGAQVRASVPAPRARKRPEAVKADGKPATIPRPATAAPMPATRTTTTTTTTAAPPAPQGETEIGSGTTALPSDPADGTTATPPPPTSPTTTSAPPPASTTTAPPPPDTTTSPASPPADTTTTTTDPPPADTTTTPSDQSTPAPTDQGSTETTDGTGSPTP
jgi:RNA polymerase sigma factor (sigma-70 family)